MTQRHSINVAGLAHEQPIPLASKIGPFIATGGVAGKDPATGKIPPDIESQCAVMFANVRLILAQAGATPDNILKMTVWVKEKSLRSHINKEWLAMFPDEQSRPARHSLLNPDMPGGVLVQCDVLAVATER